MGWLYLKRKEGIGDALIERIQPESTLGKIAVAAAGFAGDVAADPLTWVGAGLAGKTGKLIPKSSVAEKFIKAGRATGKAQDTKKVLTFAGKVLPGTEKIADPLSRAVSKGSHLIREKIPGVSDLLDKLKYVDTRFRPKGVDPVEWEKFLIGRDKAKNIEESIRMSSFEKAKEIKKAFKDEGLTDEAIEKITFDIEKTVPIEARGGRIAKEFSEKLTQKYKNVGPGGKKIIQEEGYQYLPHVLETSKLSKKIKKDLGLGSRSFTTISPSDIERLLVKYPSDFGDVILNTKTGRMYKDGQIVDIIKKKDFDESLVRQSSIDEINNAIGAKVFSADLPKLIATQGDRTAKVVGGDEFFKQLLPVGVSKEKALESGADLIESGAPELKGKFFHPEIAKHIDETYKMLTNPDEVTKFWALFDQVQNAWKGTATYWNIPFHTRNGVSNVYQNTLAGVNNPADYALATKIQSVQGNLGKYIKFVPKELTPDEKQIVKEFKKQGLGKSGWMTGDISKSVDQEINGIFDFIKKRDTKGGKVLESVKFVPRLLNKAGGAFGGIVENNAKLAHFIAKRKEGLSPFEAGMSVKKYLFDYGDLTKIEKKVFKRGAPFYTWTRKNIPLQLETLLTDPARLTKVIKAKNNVEILTGDDKTSELLPEWIKDAAPVYVGKSKEGKPRYIKLEGFLPVADLINLSHPAQLMMRQLSPIFKSPTEQFANLSFFFKNKLTRQKGLKGIVPRGISEKYGGIGERDYLWWRIPGRLEHLARLFRPISEIDKIVGRRYADKSKTAKVMAVLLGGKLYEWDEKKLLRKFDKLTNDEARVIQSQIYYLKREAAEVPEKRESNIEEIKMLREALIKSKKEAAGKRIEARESMQQ